MITQTAKFNQTQTNKNLPDINSGDTVKVHQIIKEGAPSASSGQAKERIQIFEGVVIARKHGQGISATITVRKVVDGVGVEKIFVVHSPLISKIEVVKSGKVRRSKLYYLRTTKGKKARLKKKDFAAAIVSETPKVIEEESTISKADSTASQEELAKPK